MSLASALIIGCGYVGKRVAKHYLEKGEQVFALARNDERRNELERSAIRTIKGDLDTRSSLQGLRISGHKLFYFAPPSREGSTDSRLRNFVDAVQDQPEKILLISTTGVYGDCKGDWVTEERQVNPQTNRAHRRVDMEEVLKHWCYESNIELVILRVPGIYGPSRLPLKRLRERKLLPEPEDCGYTNRIHVDDLAMLCCRAMDADHTAGTYNTSDGVPMKMADYFDLVADITGFSRLPRVSVDDAKAQINPEMMSYLQESRRIDNSKLLRELNFKLRYTDVADGLRSCL